MSLQHFTESKIQCARELRQNMTGSEQLLWERLRRKQVLGIRFRRQQIIDGFIADFYCDQAGLVIEVDGKVHDAPAQKMKDELRRKVFAARGLVEIRFKNEEISHDLDGVVNRIAEKTRELVSMNTVPAC